MSILKVFYLFLFWAFFRTVLHMQRLIFSFFRSLKIIRNLSFDKFFSFFKFMLSFSSLNDSFSPFDRFFRIKLSFFRIKKIFKILNNLYIARIIRSIVVEQLLCKVINSKSTLRGISDRDLERMPHTVKTYSVFHLVIRAAN